MIIAQAIQNLRPNDQWTLDGQEYSGFVWYGSLQDKPTEQELGEETARILAEKPYEDCKTEAKSRIAATDWAVLPDVGLANADEYVIYRAELRALIKQPVLSPIWPTEPKPIWN